MLLVRGSYVAAGLWCCQFVGRRVGRRMADGSPLGVGWCPAPWSSYAEAAVLGAALVGVVSLILRLMPPTGLVRDGLLAHALANPGDPYFSLLLLSLALPVLIAPLVEEFVFRGAVVAGLAERLGTPVACITSTALFVAVHVVEKRHYLPGFLDVGLLAIAALWLRLHYRSIRPAMLCHATYNLGVIALALIPIA